MAANAPPGRPTRSSLRGRELPSSRELTLREEARQRREDRPFEPEERQEHYAKPHHFAVNQDEYEPRPAPKHPPHEDILRTVMLGDTGYRLQTWDTHRTDRLGKSILGYVFSTPWHTTLFVGEDFSAAPSAAIDSDETLRAILGFLTLRPGDTDREYFESYTPEQLEWAKTEAESLQEFGMDPGDLEFEPPPLVDV